MAAITVTDLNNAKVDVDHIAAIATSTALTAADRLGRTKKTLEGALATLTLVTNRGAWLTATAYSAASNDLTLQSGTWYRCVVSHTSGTFATDLAAGKWVVHQGNDAATVQFTSSAIGAAIQTLEEWLNGQWLSLQDMDVPAGDVGSVDRSANCAAALLTGRCVRIPSGMTVKISGSVLALNNNQLVLVEPGARINQITADKGVFKATGKTNAFVINLGILHGAGAWSSSWTGNGGHNERGVEFDGCTNSGLLGEGVTRNFGHAQVAVLGGSNIKIRGKLEGTHTHGTPLAAAVDNFQMGIYLADDTGNLLGTVDIDCDISGATQGIVREHRDAGTGNAGHLKIRGHIHDIPSQHGLYIQRGNLDVDITVADIALSAVKLQSPGTGMINSTMSVKVNGEDVGSHLFEVATLTDGAMTNLHLIGVGKRVGGAGLSMLGKINTLKADLVLEDALLGLEAQGANQNDIDVTITGKDFGQSGVAIYSTNSTFKIRPTLRECNTTNTASDCGIQVNSASATVELIDPDVTDADGLMIYGLFNVAAGSVVKVRGSAKFAGGALGDVRATGLITEWPTEALPTNIARITSLQNISSAQPMMFTGQSVSTTNIVLCHQDMPDESAFLVEIQLVGKLAGTTQRKAWKLSAMFYRDGGICTLQDTVTEVMVADSASFAGVYSLASDGVNGIVLRVNSGGATTYDWAARLIVVKVL